jgi:hypothetical protein
MATLIRMELWDELACNAGTRQGFVPLDEVYGITEHLELGGEEYIDFSVNPLGTWAFSHGSVIRLLYDDDDWDEYRVRVTNKTRDQNGAVTREIRAYGVKFDLAHATKLMAWEQVSGLILLHHELVDITPEDMIDAIIDQAILPSYFSKGTIDNTTDPFTISWDWETPLSAIEELATVTKLELSVTRNGTTDYLINLLSEVGSTAENPQIRFAKNIISASVEEDSSAMATLIYPKGEGPQGNAATVGDMRFRAIAQGGEPTNNYHLVAWNGPYPSSNDYLVISEADQYNGFYLEDQDNNLYQITDSDIAGTNPKIIDVTLASSISITQQVVHIREKATIEGQGGAELVYIPSPSGITAHGYHSLVLERLDIPGVTNLISDPFLETWPNANQHTTVGSPTVTVVAAPHERCHYGQSVLKVECDAGEGIVVFVGHQGFNVEEIIQPGRPHLSFQVWMYQEQGQAEFYIDFFGPIVDLETGEVVDRWPAVDALDGDGNDVSSAKTDLIDQADEDKGNFFHLTLEPQRLDFDKGIRRNGGLDWTGDSIRYTILATVDASVFYVDAVQMVNSTVVGDKIVAGSSTSQLWDAAIRAYYYDAINQPKRTVNIDTLDLERLDAATYPYDEIFPGVTVAISDPELDAVFDGSFEKRVFSVDRDLKHEALTQVELVDDDVA